MLVSSNAGETARENLSDGAYDAAGLLKVAYTKSGLLSKFLWRDAGPAFEGAVK